MPIRSRSRFIWLTLCLCHFISVGSDLCAVSAIFALCLAPNVYGHSFTQAQDSRPILIYLQVIFVLSLTDSVLQKPEKILLYKSIKANDTGRFIFLISKAVLVLTQDVSLDLTHGPLLLICTENFSASYQAVRKYVQSQNYAGQCSCNSCGKYTA